MARRAIVLTALPAPPNHTALRIGYWVPVPALIQYKFAGPSKTSIWPNVTSDELTAIRAGQFDEQTGDIDVENGADGTATAALLSAAAVADYLARVAAMEALTAHGLVGYYMDENGNWHAPA